MEKKVIAGIFPASIQLQHKIEGRKAQITSEALRQLASHAVLWDVVLNYRHQQNGNFATLASTSDGTLKIAVNKDGDLTIRAELPENLPGLYLYNAIQRKSNYGLSPEFYPGKVDLPFGGDVAYIRSFEKVTAITITDRPQNHSSSVWAL